MRLPIRWLTTWGIPEDGSFKNPVDRGAAGFFFLEVGSKGNDWDLEASGSLDSVDIIVNTQQLQLEKQ